MAPWGCRAPQLLGKAHTCLRPPASHSQAPIISTELPFILESIFILLMGFPAQQPPNQVCRFSSCTTAIHSPGGRPRLIYNFSRFCLTSGLCSSSPTSIPSELRSLPVPSQRAKRFSWEPHCSPRRKRLWGCICMNNQP